MDGQDDFGHSLRVLCVSVAIKKRASGLPEALVGFQIHPSLSLPRRRGG